MDRLWMIFAVIITALLGFIVKIIRRNYLYDRLENTILYRERFAETIKEINEKGTLHQENYIYLTKKAAAIQEELEWEGIIPQFCDIEGKQHRNYPIVLNSLQYIRNFKNYYGQNFVTVIGIFDDCFIRHIGKLEHLIDSIDKEKWNPLELFREGIQWLIWLPVSLLSWFELISEPRYNAVKSSTLGRHVSNLLELLTLIGAVITIIVGWDDFIEFIFGIFRN